jgi:hypothetical protein
MMFKKIIALIIFIFMEIVFFTLFLLLLFGNGSIGSNFLYIESKIEFIFFRLGLGITLSLFWSTMNYILIDPYLIRVLKPTRFIIYSMLIILTIDILFLIHSILNFKH